MYVNFFFSNLYFVLIKKNSPLFVIYPTALVVSQLKILCKLSVGQGGFGISEFFNVN